MRDKSSKIMIEFEGKHSLKTNACGFNNLKFSGSENWHPLINR